MWKTEQNIDDLAEIAFLKIAFVFAYNIVTHGLVGSILSVNQKAKVFKILPSLSTTSSVFWSWCWIEIGPCPYFAPTPALYHMKNIGSVFWVSPEMVNWIRNGKELWGLWDACGVGGPFLTLVACKFIWNFYQWPKEFLWKPACSLPKRFWMAFINTHWTLHNTHGFTLLCQLFQPLALGT